MDTLISELQHETGNNQCYISVNVCPLAPIKIKQQLFLAVIMQCLDVSVILESSSYFFHRY